jgi:hypothetical protein
VKNIMKNKIFLKAIVVLIFLMMSIVPFSVYAGISDPGDPNDAGDPEEHDPGTHDDDEDGWQLSFLECYALDHCIHKGEFTYVHWTIKNVGTEEAPPHWFVVTEVGTDEEEPEEWPTPLGTEGPEDPSESEQPGGSGGGLGPGETDGDYYDFLGKEIGIYNVKVQIWTDYGPGEQRVETIWVIP